MSLYQLSHTEAWALATILPLPVQPGSALADWLFSATPPDVDALLSDATLNGLATKGYYRGLQAEAPIDEELLRSLTLISVNAALITALLRTNGKAALTRFAQCGDRYVQIGMDETHLSIHPVLPTSNLLNILLPGWFTVDYNETLDDTLPLDAFILFNHACNLADWALARSDFQTQNFTVQELLESFQRSAGWLDVFNAAKVEGVAALSELPLENEVELLVRRDYLAFIDEGFLTIGRLGKPLAAALTAPDSCTLTVTLQTWEEDAVPCAAFLHGAGRLFLLEFVPGQVHLQQIGDRMSVHSWIEKLLEQGKRAHYPEYLIPSVTADGDLQRVRVTMATPAATVAPPNQKTCPKCKALLAVDMRFCPYCGAQQVLPSGNRD